MKRLYFIAIILIAGIYAKTQIIHIPADFPAIQQGIDASAEGDTVLVSLGFYLEEVYLWKNITVGSLFLTTNDTSYISQTIIDGNNIYNGVLIMSPIIFLDSTCRLSGFTVRNCIGSGIASSWSDPVLDNLIITGNSSEFYGGGIDLFASSPRIKNVLISGNSAMERGGGVYCYEESQPVFENVTVHNNTAAEGGGIYIRWQSQPVFRNVTITGNHADGKGGGVYCYWAGFNFDSLFKCSIFGNTSEPGLGMDLFYESDADTSFSIHLDTFTVDFPSDYYAEPLHKFNIQSQHSILEMVEADLYVSPSGNDNNSGLTEANPLRTIRRAFSMIRADDLQQNVIFLKEGSYSPSGNGEQYPLCVPDHITIQAAAGETVVLNAENTGGVVYLHHNLSTTITGIQITGGLNDKGAGINAYRSHGQFADLIISDNAATHSGGGMYCMFCDLTLLSCHFTDNHSAADGGGIYFLNSSMFLDQCEITGNSAVSHGGGIGFYGYNETSEIVNSEISYNNSANGGGIVCFEYSKPVLKNVIIFNNNATSNGGGIFCDDGIPAFYNVNITGNSASGSGGGIGLFWESFPVLINSILWDNSPQEVGFVDENNPPYYIPTKISFLYCDVQDGESGIIPLSYDEVYWLEGNIDEDPLFNGNGEDPFSLTENSPAIDHGMPDPSGLDLPPTDYLGNFRIWDGDGDGTGRIDMGACEFGSLPVGNEEHFVNPELSCCVYPNPFFSSLKIDYKLEHPGQIRFEIFNTAGELIFYHHETKNVSGNHLLIYNADDCMPGAYIFRIRSGKDIFTGKIFKAGHARKN